MSCKFALRDTSSRVRCSDFILKYSIFRLRNGVSRHVDLVVFWRQLCYLFRFHFGTFDSRFARCNKCSCRFSKCLVSIQMSRFRSRETALHAFRRPSDIQTYITVPEFVNYMLNLRWKLYRGSVCILHTNQYTTYSNGLNTNQFTAFNVAGN